MLYPRNPSMVEFQPRTIAKFDGQVRLRLIILGMLSMHPRSLLFVISILALWFLAVSTRADDTPSGAITVFTAKKIHTMDDGWPEATAVAVQDGKILSVGTLDDVKMWLGKKPFTLNELFKDKVLMPGFIEAHGHPLLGSLLLTRPLLSYLPTAQAYGPDFPGVKSIEEAATKLKEYVAAAKDPEDYLIVWGFDVVAMGRHLTKDDLDTISTTRPIVVWDASEHFTYANTAALKKRGLKKEEAAKINGVGVDKNGDLNGQFLGTTAGLYFLNPILQPYLAPDVALKNFKFLADLSRKHGITTTSELVLGAMNLDLELGLYDKFFNAPAQTIRCVSVVDAKTVGKSKGAGAIEYVKSLQKKSTDRHVIHGVKFFADDSFLGLGMQVQNPGYSDGRKGLWIVNPGKDMFEQWKPWWEAGFQIHVHTNGNAGNQATIDTLEALQAHKPRFDHRFTCQHFGISNPEQARTLKALGGVASINPYYLYYRAELNAPLVGAERSYTAARFKSLVNAGVPVSMHSDTPVGPPIPLEWVWIAVNRFGLSGKVLGPSERVTPMQAFRMVTIDAAYTLGVEDKLGSIEPGKMADFVVLDDDPLTVPVERIRDVTVWGTVLSGRVLPASEIKP